MKTEERELAIRCLKNCNQAIELLDSIHKDMEELFHKFGWDMNTWDIAKAGMVLGKEAIGIAQTIGEEDGWWNEEAK